MITDATTRAIFDISSSVPTSFPFTFYFAAYADFYAVVTLSTGAEEVLARGTDFTLSAPGEGGTLTRIRAWNRLAAQLTLYRETPITQNVDFRNGDISDAEVHETAHDRAVAIIQEADAVLDRAIVHPESDPAGTTYEIPAVAARANHFLGWDASGNTEAKDALVLAGADLGTGWTAPLSNPLAAGWPDALIAPPGAGVVDFLAAALGTDSAAILAAGFGAGWAAILAATYAAMRDELSPVGEIKPWPGYEAPSANFMLCQGGTLARASYPVLYGRLTKSIGNFTVTIASPGVFTLAAHGLQTGDCTELTTTGALPTGLSANTNYYVIRVGTDDFRLATTLANALANTAINTSGSQSGTHTLRYCPWGISGAANFLVPDAREASFYGIGTRATGITAHDAKVLGQFADDQGQGHFHDFGGSGRQVGYRTLVGGGQDVVAGGSYSAGVITTTGSPATDGLNGTPRTGTTTRGKIIGMNWIIRIQ